MVFLEAAKQQMRYLSTNVNNDRLNSMSPYDYGSGFGVGVICAYGHAARVAASEAHGYGSEQYNLVDCLCMSLYNESKFLLRNAQAAIEQQQNTV